MPSGVGGESAKKNKSDLRRVQVFLVGTRVKSRNFNKRPLSFKQKEILSNIKILVQLVNYKFYC